MYRILYIMQMVECLRAVKPSLETYFFFRRDRSVVSSRVSRDRIVAGQGN